MILVLDAVAIAVVAGFLTGGRFASLARLRLRGEGLLVAGLLAQILLPRLVPRGLVSDSISVALFWGLPSLLVFLALLANWRLIGAAIASAGVGLNLLVVLLNSGMPVLLPAGTATGVGVDRMVSQIQSSWLHVEVTTHTRLLILADVVPLVGPTWHRGMVSLGDIMLAVGVAHLVFSAMHTAEE